MHTAVPYTNMETIQWDNRITYEITVRKLDDIYSFSEPTGHKEYTKTFGIRAHIHTRMELYFNAT
jgi:hypothetical protein